MKRLVTGLVTAVTLLLVLSGCNPKTDTPEGSPLSPENEPSAAGIAASLDTLFDTDAMFELDPARMLKELTLDDGAVAEFVMKVPTGTNQDEYGVFAAAPGREQDVVNAVNSYLTSRQDKWMDEYLPEERPKIFNAVSKSQGRFVMYVMAPEDVRVKAAETFELSVDNRQVL
jgi:hypothetical protein